jgi:poly(A) polymerase/tRNA nucleotidyltransferase (CCA-adding enzyme)
MQLPQEVKNVLKTLEKNGYEAFVVGGCVRDILRGVEPRDWDITTNALPENITKIFPKSYLDNKFGTVTVLTGSKKPSLKEVEITPYRIDEKYSDKRHPDKISWAKTIEQDLARRDFTVNAIALNLLKNGKLEIIDPFLGREDIEKRIIKAVGKAKERFSEDALRMMRAVRFAVTLGPAMWQIEKETEKGIKENAALLEVISKERIRDELVKIMMSENGAKGIEILRRLGLLKYIIPELEEGFGMWQNKHHVYQVYQHALLSLNYACKQGFSKYVRFAALLHDIGKPRTKKGEGPDCTFYNHEVVGEKMTRAILQRLRFSKKETEKIAKLVRYHLFYYNVGEVGPSSVRRLLRKVGREDIEELLQVRYCDRIGSGVPKAEPYRLRHLKYMIEKVSQDAISTKMLKVSGEDVMKILKIPPGPKVGWVLGILLKEALFDAGKNKREYLEKEIERLGKIDDKTLEEEAQKAKREIELIETKRDEMTKKRYWIS